MTPVEEMTYAEALAELETIMAALRSDSCSVDKLVEMTRRAEQLLTACRKRLTTTSEALADVLAKLEAD